MEQKEDHGGFAGIHVPWNDLNNNGTRDAGEQAELNLFGEGTVIAIGGNAGDGVDSSELYGGARRSDGAGAGIGRKSVEKVEMLIKLKLMP